MIQPINNIRYKQTGKLDKTTPPETKSLDSKILNTYEQHLKVTSPTYSEEIRMIMDKKGIKENHLNAKIIETMKDDGIGISKRGVDLVVNQLQKSHLFDLFKKGYDVETLTLNIIEEQIKNSISEAENDDDKGTDNNQSLDQYKAKIEDLSVSSDTSIASMVANKSDITINNLYTAKHKSSNNISKETPTNQQIIAVLNMNGIKVTQGNMNAARNLIRGNVEITKQNVRDFVEIKDLIKNLDINKLVEEGAREIEKGNNPADVTLVSLQGNNAEEYKEIKRERDNIIQDIPRINNDVIKETYNKGEPITLENLQKNLHENLKKLTSEDRQRETEPVVVPNLEDKVVSTRRELEEIRLKLTLEAALKLNKKIDIKTSDLSEVVKELRAIEDKNNEDILSSVGAEVTEENIDKLGKTNNKLYNILRNKEIAIAEVVKGKSEFTIESIDGAINKRNIEKIYEELATRPEKRFGEGISIVENQIEDVLTKNSIDISKMNVKAAKALIENGIEVSQELVDDAKGALIKIETVLYELRPVVVATMIKDGINPDTMPVDNLINYIKDIKEKKGIDSNQKIAEAILELDQAGELTGKQRDGLIAVYRMLNTIKKNETAALGFLLEHNKEATLANLFEASKYIEKLNNNTGKMDILVDDSLGVRQGELPKNIRSIIEAATQVSASDENVNKWINNRNVIDQWLSRITPEELKKYINMDKSLEELELKENKISQIEMDRIVKQVKNLGEISSSTIEFIKDKNIFPAVRDIYWIDRMLKEPYLLGDMLEEYTKLTNEEIHSTINKSNDSIQEVVDSLEEEIRDKTDSCLSAPDNIRAYNTGRELIEIIGRQKEIFSDEGFYQLPVELNTGMTNLNIYLIDDDRSQAKDRDRDLTAHMSIKTKNLGIIQVNMKISDRSIVFEMLGEKPEITAALERDSQNLKKAIEEIGYKVMQAKFIQYDEEKSDEKEITLPKALLEPRFKESKFEHII